MEMKDMIDYIISNGMSVVIIGYFLFRDWKYNEKLMALMVELRECVSQFSNIIKEQQDADK